MTNREIIIKEEKTSNYKYYCKCGHTVVIYPMENKVKKICSWCGNWVYIDKKVEFKEKFGRMRVNEWKY